MEYTRAPSLNGETPDRDTKQMLGRLILPRLYCLSRNSPPPPPYYLYLLNMFCNGIDKITAVMYKRLGNHQTAPGVTHREQIICIVKVKDYV